MRVTFGIKSVVRMGIAAALSFCLIGTETQAATVALPEAELDAIFSQKSFKHRPIDIRFGALQTLVAPALQNVASEPQMNQLFDVGGRNASAINLYLVDSISYCGEYNTGILGCGLLGQSGVIVERRFSLGPLGHVLIGHEMVHNLGLGHTNAPGLMNAQLSHNTELTRREAKFIHFSPFVQQDTAGYFINVTPYQIVNALPTPVPLPSGGMVMLGAVGGFVVLARARRRRMSSAAG